MPTSTIALRKKIAREFCRTILWIDDEIRPDAENVALRGEYRELFSPFAEEISNQGILCQLKSFPQINGTEDPFSDDAEPVLEVCTKLARQSDVVLLDWHLGQTGNSMHSCKIIRDILREDGVSFIIILSQEPHLDSQFRAEFSDTFGNTPNEGGWYSDGRGKFICLLQKSEFRVTGGGHNLVERIYTQLAYTHPDYLHWAAIEIAARIKRFAPTWLANLPRGADLGILAEQIHSSEDVGHTIFENLMEDLKEAINYPSLESIRSDALEASRWLSADNYRNMVSTDLNSLRQQCKQGVAARIIQLMPLSGAAIERANNAGDLFKKIMKDAPEVDCVKQLIEGVHNFGEFCEIKSCKPDASKPVKRGTVFCSDEEVDTIWVCVSQSCDCLREDSLLFMRGLVLPEGTAGSSDTSLQFKGKKYVFRSSAESLRSIRIIGNPRMPDGLSPCGQIRETILARLVARYWSHATRVGVDQPRILRESRNEKP